jgi:phosphoribosyl 1,2-cyclic phosphate phosphodiesterase
MEITFLGTGTSQGIPVIACQCPVCRSNDPSDKRLRTALLLHDKTTTIAIDAGPDFRQQMLSNNVKKLDAVLITHGHKDHTGGLDDVRAYNWVQKKAMDIYARTSVLEIVKREFPYAFGENKYPGAPMINLHDIPDNAFAVGDFLFTPVEALHGKMPVLGFRTRDLSYLTDASAIEDKELTKMKGSRVVIINALRKEKHHSHFTLQEAIDLLQYLQPEKGYLTHISHQMGRHHDVQKTLPENIFLAYDGLTIHL